MHKSTRSSTTKGRLRAHSPKNRYLSISLARVQTKKEANRVFIRIQNMTAGVHQKSVYRQASINLNVPPTRSAQYAFSWNFKFVRTVNIAQCVSTSKQAGLGRKVYCLDCSLQPVSCKKVQEQTNNAVCRSVVVLRDF